MQELRRLREDDLETYLELRRVAFPGPDYGDEEIRQIMAGRLPYTTGLFREGELACSYSMYPVTVFFAGQTTTVGALAAVAGAAEQRRRGLVREALVHALGRLHEEGIGWCLESPFDPRFYARLGWQSLPWGSLLELPSDLLLTTERPRARRLPVSELESVAPIYGAWAKRFTFAFTRQDDPRGSWTRYQSKRWLDGDGFLYLLDDAYLLFTFDRVDGRLTAVVEDYAHATAAGRSALLAFLGALHGQADLVRIHVPHDDPLSLQFASRHLKKGSPHFQARIADLNAALAPMASQTPARIRLRLHDEICPWNDGTFLVATSPVGTEVSRAEGSEHDARDLPLAEMPVATLPLLVTASVSPAAALAAGAATGDVQALSALTALGQGVTTFLPSADSF